MASRKNRRQERPFAKGRGGNLDTEGVHDQGDKDFDKTKNSTGSQYQQDYDVDENAPDQRKEEYKKFKGGMPEANEL